MTLGDIFGYVMPSGGTASCTIYVVTRDDAGKETAIFSASVWKGQGAGFLNPDYAGLPVKDFSAITTDTLTVTLESLAPRGTRR